MTRLYPGMAFTNIKSNKKTYLPYMLSCIVTISIYYIICSLASNKDIAKLWGGNIIQSYMSFGQLIVSIFALIFLFYINSFLVKKRTGEFGLYNILGMEKRHISKILFFETLYSFLISMSLGLIIGILLDKLMYMIVLNMLEAEIPMGFYISGLGVLKTVTLFGFIFLLILLNSIRQIYRTKPVDLLKSSSAGEREPKAKWALAVIGLICLCSGYFIAVTTKNPIAAFTMFFAAVILVIIGTYMVFTSGSIAFLKLLKKKKSYYYNTKHFISVSGMMYRMKRNAVSLGNICILSTMVIVIVSTTLSMYLGANDSVNKRYPKEIMIEALTDDPMLDDVIDIVETSFNEAGLPVRDQIMYRDLSISTVYEKDTDEFVTNPAKYQGADSISAFNQISTLVFIPLEDYNKTMGTNEKLDQNDVLVYSNRVPLNSNKISVLGKNYNVRKTLDNFLESGSAVANITSSHFIVVKDMSVIDELYELQKEAYGDAASFISTHYMADVTGNPDKNKDTIINTCADVKKTIKSHYPENSFTGRIECRSGQKDSYLTDFSGLFFIGIFLGLLFVIATVLIMYYKQITEGYDDKERFEIMQNVGMSQTEVRKTINSQVLTVFFLPLITAGIHVAFAFPFIYKILTLLSLFNIELFAYCSLGCFLAFALFYGIVYMLTSKLYYGIVKK